MASQGNFFIEATSQNLSSVLHRVIGNTFIVEYGIIKAIPSEGVVTVEMSVAEKEKDVVITDCVLASFASSSVTVRIEPNIDDKVIILFPRKFHNDMFQVDKNETIISDVGTGYNLFSGIAILLNQYQEATHKNYIDIVNGTLTLKLAYNEDDDKNLFELNINEKGAIILKSGYNKDNDKNLFELNINEEGAIVLKSAYNKDDDKNLFELNINEEGAIAFNNDVTSVSIDAEGNNEIDNGKAKISVDKEGALAFNNDVTSVSIDAEGNYEIDNSKSKISVDKNGNVKIDAMSGKISIKNSSANLFSILDGMLQTLNTSLATAGSPASHTVVPQQFAQQSTQLSQLME